MDGLDFRVLREEDHDEVVDFIMKNFYPDEPTSKCLGISEEEYRGGIEIELKSALCQKVSFGVYDKETNELCAVRINLLGEHREAAAKPQEEEVGEMSLKVRQVFAAQEFLFGESIGTKLGTKSYFEFLLVSVRDDYRKRGIATELYKRSEEKAREFGCTVMVIVSTSAHSLKAARKLGFECHTKISYTEYVDPITGEKIFKDIKKPHVLYASLVKKL